MNHSRDTIAETPLMRQYLAIKQKHPDAILLFRVGDFYETFSSDAIKASRILGITLTRRANGAAQHVELAGFPHHALDTYLPKLVRAGERVAICDQLEDPKTTKTIVRRGVTELVTPGVAIGDNILDHRESNFLASLHLEEKAGGVAFLDLSTGEFLATEGSFDYLDKIISGFKPKEIIFEKGKRQQLAGLFGNKHYVYPLDDWAFTGQAAGDRLIKQFDTTSLKGFGIDNLKLAIIASGAILHYLDLTQHDKLSHITGLSRIEDEKHVWLDKFTMRNLELFNAVNEGGKSLVDVIDSTVTAMGSRLLKRWLAMPLKDVSAIRDRQVVVEHFFREPELKVHVENLMRPVGDLERLVSKIAMGRVTPREVAHLNVALRGVAAIKECCSNSACPGLKQLGEQFNACALLQERVAREVEANPPAAIGRGMVIRHGVSAELDELRIISTSGKTYLENLQKQESERTGIPSLKISYNNVFGYFIEVRNTHKDKVPADWIRKQTLVNAERYITGELKDYESKIVGAEERILAIETELFNRLVVDVSAYIPALKINAALLARLDCLSGFATTARKNNYVCPVVDDSLVIDIKGARHPVIEKQLPPGEAYVPNDIYLDNDHQQICVITGPNMSGKSALLRQTALVVLLSQVGSFVPAESATVGVVDKIFTRVGASDNISLGESTFMVEMNEAASIINNLSNRSLVLFDELGRGTSTYDGISIAWSIIEYLHENPRGRAKTLFATHYHELNEMAKTYRRCKNFNVSVKEVENKVVFSRKLEPGGSNHSFGIHVARMAGLPKSVVRRAGQILEELEGANRKGHVSKPVGNLAKKREGYQLSIFQLDDPVLKQVRDQLAALDINNLTPVEALNKLNEIKRIAGI